MNTLRHRLNGKMVELRQYRARLETREFTPQERAEVDRIKAEIEELKAKIVEVEGHLPPAMEEEMRQLELRPRKAPVFDDKYANRFGGEFSLFKAVRSLAEQGRLDDASEQVTRDLARRDGRQLRGPNSFLLPLQTRAVNRTNGAGMLTEQYEDILSYLRKSSVIGKLGVKIMPDIEGKLVLPKVTAGSSGQWVAEGDQVTGSNVTIGSVTLAPRALCASVTFSRQLLKQSSYDVEATLMDDLKAALAESLDAAVIAGSGSGEEPTGFLHDSSVAVVSKAGASIAYTDLLELERLVKESKAPGEMKYLTSPKGGKTLKMTPRLGTEVPSFVMEDGFVNGYEAVESNFVPTDISSGSSTNLTAIFFGDFADAGVVALWGSGAEVVVDPYTRASYNEIVLHAYLDCDFKVRRGSSLRKMVF
ncbi:phage major capsid protein [Tautonia sociabilis]|nr:phage major capsid protein [Tautonia sociabilis]